MYSSYTVVLSVAVIVLINFVSPSRSCFAAFKNAQNITFVQTDCTTSAGFSAMPSSDDLSKDDFDDKVEFILILK